MEKYKIFIDMDGVLCDFLKAASLMLNKHIENHVIWKSMRKEGHQAIKKAGTSFWKNLEWTSYGKQLWNSLIYYQDIKNVELTILSAYPSSDFLITDAIAGKKDWLEHNINKNIANKAILCAIQDKQLYSGPNKILIDDNLHTIEQWRAKGGIGLYCNCNEDIISVLISLDILLS